jgi:hypothetical protein
MLSFREPSHAPTSRADVFPVTPFVGLGRPLLAGDAVPTGTERSGRVEPAHLRRPAYGRVGTILVRGP